MDQSGTPNPKALSPLVWIILAVVVLAVAGGVFYAVTQNEGNRNIPNVVLNSNVSNVNAVAQNTNATNSNRTITNADAYAGWGDYRSAELGFTVKYPTNWSASAVGVDGALNHQAFDAILSEGECDAEACNLPSGFCRVTIGRLAYPLTNEASPERAVDDLRSRAKATIESVSFPGFTGYRTKVSAAPPDANGAQPLGTYYLIPLQTRTLQAYLERGYSREACDEALEDILGSLHE